MNDLIVESSGQNDEYAPTLVWKKHGKKPGKSRNVHPYTTEEPSSNAPSTSGLFGNAESEGKTDLQSPLGSDPYRMNQVGRSQTPLDMQNQNYPSMFEEPSRNSSESGEPFGQA